MGFSQVRGSLRADDDARLVGVGEVVNGHRIASALVNRDFLGYATYHRTP
jgi:hypothetical protein